MPRVVASAGAKKKMAVKKAVVKPVKADGKANASVRLGRGAKHSMPTAKALSAEHSELIRQLLAKRNALAHSPYLSAQQLHPFKVKPARTIELAKAAGILDKAGNLSKKYR